LCPRKKLNEFLVLCDYLSGSSFLERVGFFNANHSTPRFVLCVGVGEVGGYQFPQVVSLNVWNPFAMTSR
jgi:hypothetical protein